MKRVLIKTPEVSSIEIEPVFDISKNPVFLLLVIILCCSLELHNQCFLKTSPERKHIFQKTYFPIFSEIFLVKFPAFPVRSTGEDALLLALDTGTHFVRVCNSLGQRS